RGAGHAHLFEIDAQARRIILRNADELKLADRITLRGMDASRPGTPAVPADLVFLDPPYRSGLAGLALTALDAQGWLKPDALVTVRTAAEDSFAAPPGFVLREQRQRGPARLSFLLKSAAS